MSWGIRLPGAGDNSCRDHVDRLQLGRKWSEQIGAVHMHDFADQLMPSSASPRATISALGVVAARAFRIDLALISWAMQDGRALFRNGCPRSAYRRVV